MPGPGFLSFSATTPQATLSGLNETLWMVVIGGVAAVLHSVTLGATLTANCWGPALGAKVVTYRTALILGLICQSIGVLAFGPLAYPAYGGFLTQQNMLELFPGLCMYAMMWIVVTPVIWQALAIWQVVLVPAYLGTVASTIGATLVFPGAAALDFSTSNRPPYLTGLGPVFFVWGFAPLVSVSFTCLTFLYLRNWFYRGEDSMHRVLWVLPAAACFVCMVCGLLLMYTIGSPYGTMAFVTTPQGACMVLAGVGSLGCIVMCLGIPNMSRRLRRRAPVALKRMSQLGLDDATVQELSADNVTVDLQSWLQRTCKRLFQPDLFTSVPRSQTLLRIHSTAEEFEATAESFLGPFQITLGMFLSVAYGANNGHTAMGSLAMLRSIHTAGEVPAAVAVSITLRCVSAVAMAIGTLFWGKRLAPITGVQLAAMTPFRSYVVTAYSAAALAALGAVQLRDDVITYVIVSGVVAVGFAEGTQHVNWKLLGSILLWWISGFGLVLLVTSALVAQGMYSPSFASSGTGQ